MKKLAILLAAPLLLAIAGCAPQAETVAEQPAPTSAPLKLTSAQELAKYCRICVVDKGEKMEEFLPARLDKKVGSQTYKFCTDACRKKFDQNPKPYMLKP